MEFVSLTDYFPDSCMYYIIEYFVEPLNIAKKHLRILTVEEETIDHDMYKSC